MIKWSFSGLKDYVNCPRQYYEVKVAKSVQKEVSKQMLYGTAVHEALENYVKDGTPLPKNYQQFARYIDPLKNVPGQHYPEHEMALTENREPCDFSGTDYWVRGIVDLLIVDGDRALIVDYKTGRADYADPDQLKLMALMAYAHFPEVDQIKASLMFVAHDRILFEEYRRDKQEELWEVFTPKLKRLEVSYENNFWPENPNFLCRKWCPVKACRFNGER
jgi:ATP-dependent exoDNAse (exonuclease V) beta subunit